MMSSHLNRRQFCRSTALLTLGLLTKDFLFLSPAIANETQPNDSTSFQEKYIIFVPFVKARQGGKMNVTLYSGKPYLLDIPSHCSNATTLKVKGIGDKGNNCLFELYTLYDSQTRVADKVYAEIEKTKFLNHFSKSACKLEYEQVEDGQAVSDLATLELLGYVIGTSSLDENIKNRYELANKNCRLLEIAKTIDTALGQSTLNQEQQTLVRGTFEYIKSGLPIPNWQALNQLDSIIYNSKLSNSLKQTYAVGSAISRALTVDYLIIEEINNNQKLTSDFKPRYLSIYQNIRDGQEVSDTDNQALNSFILQSDLPANAKIVYLETHRRGNIDNQQELTDQINDLVAQGDDFQDQLKEAYDQLKEGYNTGKVVTPTLTKLVSVLGVEAGTGVSIGTLSGAAATNATLAFLGGGSVAAGGLGMLGGLAVVTGGAALIGAAGIVSIGLVSQMNSEDLKNLGIAVGGGTLVGATAVFAAWTAATALGVAGTLSGAAAITTTIAALGGLSVVTGGAALVASGAAYVIWSVLQSHHKRDQGLLEQLETRLYTLTEQPLADSFEHLIISQIEDHYSKEEGFSAPAIPLNLLVNAHKSWLAPNSNEKVIALIDSSMRDDGKEGLVFTNERVIWKKGSTETASYDDIGEFLNNPTLWKSNLKKYQDLSAKIQTLSDFFQVDTDNEKLMRFLDELSQKYQLTVA